MSKIKSILWELTPHTEVKHKILKKYLDCWFPILGSCNRRILYIDGFSGPGEYKGGQEGSPLVAIKAVINHSAKLKCEIIMHFIEADKNRYQYLESKIKDFTLPKNLKIACINNTFAGTLTDVLNDIEQQGKKLAPSFVLIDPFGFTGIPLDIIRRIMKNNSCEVMITFMYEEMNRFVSDQKLWKSLGGTFDTDKWKRVNSIKEAKAREEFLYNLYKSQLEKVGIKHVLSFKMKNKNNKTDYFLFYGTNKLIGVKKMKEAMWSVDKSGSFQFSDVTNPRQTYLIEPRPDYDYLKKLVLIKFKGKVVRIPDLEEFVLLETPFRETHYKKSILYPMEFAKEPEIVVHGTRSRRGTYPITVKVEFL